MDNHKDNNSQHISSVSQDVSHKNTDHISFYEKDVSFVYVYKKTEKLATALYMITNLFSDAEPMKWTLRRKVSELLSFTVGYKDVLSSQYTDFAHTIKTRVFEIVSLLDVSSRSGLVSPMNFSVVKEEFSKLVTTLDSLPVHDSSTMHSAFSPTFFETPHSNGVPTFSQRESVSIIKDKPPIKDTDPLKRNNRQNIIIGLLKKKGDLTIKDISLVIRDCSEKTIQRELISLIEAGVLKKTGERRWTRYSLKVAA